MGYDFDGRGASLVNASALRIAGQEASTGAKWQYSALSGDVFDIDGVFDAAWATVGFNQGRHGSMVPVSTTAPRLGVRLSDFPAGVSPKQGDALTRPNGLTYEVSDVQPDSFGWVALILTQTN